MRLRRNVNFYIATLIITVVGSAATLMIVKVGVDADAAAYGGPARQDGEVPALLEELKRR